MSDPETATKIGLTPDQRASILRVAKLHGATLVRLFGSTLHQPAGPGSDIDLLVDLPPEASLLDVIAIKQDLEELLGLRFDVLTEAAISCHFRAQVLAEALVL